MVKPQKTLAAALALSILSTAAFAETVLHQALSNPDPTFDGRHGAHAAALVDSKEMTEIGVRRVPGLRAVPPTETGVPSVPALHGRKPPAPVPKPDIEPKPDNPKPSPSQPSGAWKDRLRDGLSKAKSGIISVGKKIASTADKLITEARKNPLVGIGVSLAAAAVGLAVAGPAGAVIAAGAAMIFMIATSP